MDQNTPMNKAEFESLARSEYETFSKIGISGDGIALEMRRLISKSIKQGRIDDRDLDYLFEKAINPELKFCSVDGTRAELIRLSHEIEAYMINNMEDELEKNLSLDAILKLPGYEKLIAANNKLVNFYKNDERFPVLKMVNRTGLDVVGPIDDISVDYTHHVMDSIVARFLICGSVKRDIDIDDVCYNIKDPTQDALINDFINAISSIIFANDTVQYTFTEIESIVSEQTVLKLGFKEEDLLDVVVPEFVIKAGPFATFLSEENIDAIINYLPKDCKNEKLDLKGIADLNLTADDNIAKDRAEFDFDYVCELFAAWKYAFYKYDVKPFSDRRNKMLTKLLEATHNMYN